MQGTKGIQDIGHTHLLDGKQMMFDDLTNDARVLVAILPSVRDFMLARTKGWYRVPLARAPRHVNAEVLAFYQTAAFGTERWAVRYAALVQRVRIVSRLVLLPEEHNHPRANEQYLCFDIGPLELLPMPIPSHTLRRITFIPTTLGQLLRARDVVELWRPINQQLDHEVWAAGLAGRSLR